MIRKSLTIASARTTLSVNQTKTVRLVLNGGGKRLLRRFHRLPAKLTVSASRRLVAGKSLVFRTAQKRRRRR